MNPFILTRAVLFDLDAGLDTDIQPGWLTHEPELDCCVVWGDPVEGAELVPFDARTGDVVPMIPEVTL